MWGTTTLASFLVPVYLATSVFCTIHEIWWNITYVDNVNPDGLFPRRVIGVNNTWPPPPIDVHSRDRLVVHIRNSLDKPTALHHHGMFFSNSSWMDGARGISQCGIPPGGEFTYVVPINRDNQWGTYWVHAHSSGEYVDGLRAPLVIHPNQEVHKYDREFTVVLGDWYHQQHDVLIKDFISSSNPFGLEPGPDAALIYFSEREEYLRPKQDTTHAAVGFNENATLPFQPGKTYRLRIVNTSAFSSFFFWIDGHDMRVIEVDGTDVEEYPIDMINVAVAQRYSVLVTARSDSSSNWAIHANLDLSMFPVIPANLNPNVTASINYRDHAPLKNSGNVTAYHRINDTALVSIPAIAQPCVTRTICLEATFSTMTDGTNHGMFNGITHNFPLVPAMFSALTLGANATVPAAYGPTSFVLKYGEVVDLIVKNGAPGGHPFHLHGHKFMIVNRAQNYKSSDPSVNPPIVEGQANPVRRDTAFIPAGQSATLRFVATNPGAWLLHCHIEWHFEVGLAVQFIEAPLEAQASSANIFPASVLDSQCAALGLPYSGNAAGHASTTDLSGLPLGPYPARTISNQTCAPVYVKNRCT